MSASVPANLVPSAGLLATVRNRCGVISAVQPFDGETGRLHLVHQVNPNSVVPEDVPAGKRL